MVLGEDSPLAKSRRNRQWLGVFLKNWTLFCASFGGFLSVLVLTFVLMLCIILLHRYYLNSVSTASLKYDVTGGPSGDSSNDSNIVVGNWISNPYPSLAPTNIFNIHYLSHFDLGSLLYSSALGQSKGYLSALEKPFNDISLGLALRTEYGTTSAIRTNPAHEFVSDSTSNYLTLKAKVPYYTNFTSYYDNYLYMNFTGPGIEYSKAPDNITAAGVSNEDKLFYHAKRTSELYRDAVSNTSNPIYYNDGIVGIKVNEIPSFGIRFGQAVSPSPIRIARESDGDVLSIDYSYDTFFYSKMQAYYIDQTDHDRLLEIQVLHFHLCLRNMVNQIYGVSTSATGSVEVDGPLIIGKNAPFWRRSTGDFLGPDGMTPLLLGLVIPLLMFIVSPLMIFALVEEKSSGMVHLHSMMGQKYTNRWLADFTYNFILSFCVAVLLVIMCYAGDLNGIRMNTFAAWLPMFLLFSANVAIFSAFIAAFFESGRIAALLAVVIAFGYAVGGFLGTANFASTTIIDRSISPWFALIPFFGPISVHSQLQSLAILQTDSLYLHITDLRFYVYDSLLSRAYVGQSVSISLILSVISTVLMALLSMYIDLVMPKKTGIPNHWLFFLLPVVNKVDKLRGRRTKHITTGSICKAVTWALVHPDRMCCSQRRNTHISPMDSTDFKPHIPESERSREEHVPGHLLSTAVDPLSPNGGRFESSTQATSNAMSIDHLKTIKSTTHIDCTSESDVSAESKRAKCATKGFNERPVLIRAIDLTKTYPATRLSPEKHAVRGVSFTVAEGECLGLLGPNGAAKTTTINILTMLHRATTGEAYVLDKSLVDPYNKAYIQSVTGICPQFDILYPTLTCRQHLKYSCRLKNIAREDEKTHIDELLESVGLVEKANSKVKSLSGGQKRRLSVAIALTGSPSVLYLDEPSTGLDPVSKRLLWNIILRIRSHRAILLTTHAMDEAQALCNRIAIMDRGLLKCIGKCTYLQERYGGALQIMVEVTHDSKPGSGVTVNGVSLNYELEEMGHKLMEETFGSSVLLRNNVAGTLTYDVSDKLTAPHAFIEMAKLARTQKKVIYDWSLLQASLDRVFFNVILSS